MEASIKKRLDLALAQNGESGWRLPKLHVEAPYAPFRGRQEEQNK